MSHRSVIQALDLHDDYGDYHGESCAPQNCGWLSPRISFSTDFIGMAAAAERALSPGKKMVADGNSSGHLSSGHLSSGGSSPSSNYSAEFEFSMSAFNIFDSASGQGRIVPADELFHQGKLLPGFTPCATTSTSAGAACKVLLSADALIIPERRPPCPPVVATTIAGHLVAETGSAGVAVSPPSSLGCALGPSCVRTSKGTKWRELFGALRRVKSDSGRQRVPDESLLPPLKAALHTRKKFFKQLFSGAQPGTCAVACAQEGKMLPPTCGASARPPCSTSPSAAVSSVQERTNLLSSDPSVSTSYGSSAITADSLHRRAASARLASAPHATTTSSEAGRGDFKLGHRGRYSSEQLSDDFSFNPIPNSRGWSASASSSSTSSSTTSGASSTRGSSSSSSSGRSSPSRAPSSRKMDRSQSASLVRSGSGRVIVRGLDRGPGSGRHSASFQEQIRALRSREIRRSPDRSGTYTANVRVTPVLNVPVCMGPVLRGATKAGKGRLSNFRSMLTFKSKIPTSVATPIATR